MSEVPLYGIEYLRIFGFSTEDIHRIPVVVVHCVATALLASFF